MQLELKDDVEEFLGDVLVKKHSIELIIRR